MLLSRDLMLRKWILQVGSAPPSALTSPAHQLMRLVSKHLGNSKERVPAQWHVMLLSGLSPASVQIAFHIRQRMNSACAKILFVSFLILLSLFCYYSLSGLALCLGLFCVCQCSKHVQRWITVKPWRLWVVFLTEYCTALPSPWLAGHLYFGGFFWYLVVLHSCWAYLLSTWGRSLVRAFTGSACEACFAAMKISIRTCMSWYFIMFLLLV